MDEQRLTERVSDKRVRHDLRVLADFVRIYCDGHHAETPRRPAETAVAGAGVYKRKRPTLCVECETHLSYAEQRRAACPKDPKPYCSFCDTHCYRPSEAEWQRTMMRYSGPRSWRHGHAIDGIKHVLQGRAMRREMARRAAATPDKHTPDPTGTVAPEREEAQ